MWHVWAKREVYTVFEWGDLRERTFGRPRLGWKDNVEMDLKGLA